MLQLDRAQVLLQHRTPKPACTVPTHADMVGPINGARVSPASLIFPSVLVCHMPDGTLQRTPNFLGVIPGGQSFAVPEGTLTTVPSQGLGFTWVPSLRAGITLTLMGGDARGNGTAGRIQNVVSLGISDVESCLSDSSPSSTPGTPAGGSYPTSTSGT